jgi:hypothetical protein
MRFLAGAKPEWDESTATVVFHRRIVVHDDSIEVVALLQQPSSSTTWEWVSESILRVCAGSFKGSKKFQSELNRMHFQDHHFNQL